MPLPSELNQLRRLIGDNSINNTTDQALIGLLNDTTLELTGHNFPTPLYAFDSLIMQYHNEVIIKAAINWWWDYLSKLQARVSTTVGAASQNLDALWQRALQMIQQLEERYEQVAQLYITIVEGNSSRWSKQTLRRIGGTEEENTPIPAPFSGLQPFQGLQP